MEFAYVIGVLLVSCVLGVVAQNINESKGYEGGFAWGFWLGVIGIIVVAVRPENPSRHAADSRPSTPSSPTYLSSPANWRCANCGRENYPYMRECSRCGTPKPSTVRPTTQSWKCVCGETNPSTISYCTRCRRERPEYKKATPVPTATSPAAPPSSTESSLEALEKLGKLHADGVLTDEEFAAKKAELLKKL